jgi:hypothetical protein
VVANCDDQLACARERMGDDDGALKAALAALSTFDRQRYAMSNPQSREKWAEGHFSLFGLAVDLAARRHDHRLIAELVESARGQGIPAEADGGAKPYAGDGARQIIRPPGVPEWAEPVWIDPLPFTGHRYIKVKRHSALRNADPSGVARMSRPIQLEEVAQAVGGPNAWWWGTFQTGDVLWWSLLGARGSIEAGRIDFRSTSRARRALETLFEALPVPEGGEDDTDFTRRVIRGALADPTSEGELAADLGEALLPQPLIKVFEKADSNNPVSLVVAPCPALAQVPLCALGIGDGRRLVEAAVIRYVPSAALATQVDNQTRKGVRGRGGPGPVVSGLFDPDRNSPLPHASLLASAVAGNEALIATRATKSALRHALASASVRPGSPGVFVYCGHARTPRVAGVALMCLHRDSNQPQACPIQNCCGGSPLTAAELYGQEPADEACPYPMPGRVLLSACDTSGGASAGHSGEWLALAPAMMWAGARLVIATSWPTIDDPRTFEMDVALVDLLKTHPDPAQGLRNVQLDKLHRWRTGPHDKVRLSPIRGWSPLFWAPYVAVGFHAA